MAIDTQPSWDWAPDLPESFYIMDCQGNLPFDTRGCPFQMRRPQPPCPMAHYDMSQHYYNTQYPRAIPPISLRQASFNYQNAPYSSPWAASPSDLGSHNENRDDQPTPRDQRRLARRRDSDITHEPQIPSPSTRSESLASNSRSSVSSHPTANAKTITYNEAINPGDRVNFETEIDELMKAIQSKKAGTDMEASQGPAPTHTSRADHTEPSTPGNTATRTENKPKKKWVCDDPSCNKAFVQKTHLDIHRRTHTGAKPYICTKEECGLAFSQRGNLKTHMRRHTGEKPFSCRLCGKTFAQRGNVRSHEETHKGMKPFVCKLDDCNKTFSHLGNMKTHQNTLHKDTIKRLIPMFAKFAAEGDIPEEYQELFEYFSKHYKNSNKGVKGRGKARTVAARTGQSLHQVRTSSGPTPQQPLPQTPRYHDSGRPSFADRTVTASAIPTTTATGRPFSPSHQSCTWQDVVKDEPVD